MFKLMQVVNSPMTTILEHTQPRKFVSLLVKHLTRQYGNVPDHIKDSNDMAIFNRKGHVISCNEVNGIYYYVTTQIGKRTVVMTCVENEEITKGASK